MAKLKVEIKSKDMIKPSSPTPNHFKTLQLTFLDQFAPLVHVPFIFFYQSVNLHNTILLKHSLSETLVQFYPLAGRIDDNFSIKCNDEGVVYHEANVLHSLLKEVVENPNPEELLKLLPFPPLTTNKSIVTGIQVNYFSCGGIAISVCISHKIADATTLIAFVNAWAAKAKSNHVSDVKFISPSFFPQMGVDVIYDSEGMLCKEKTVTMRVIFDKEKLEKLIKLSVDVDKRQVKAPTNAEVVSAFFWKLFIRIARTKPNPQKFFGVTQVVSLRTIKLSPMTKNCYGNLIWTTFALTPIEKETKYSEAVGKLREVVKQIDTSYLQKIQTGECFQDLQKAYESLNQEVSNFCGISSCNRFPLYEVNFGWGTPIWVSMTKLPFKNTVFLLSTKCGEGIEAWVNVLEQDVAELERDHEFLSLVSHNINAKM